MTVKNEGVFKFINKRVNTTKCVHVEIEVFIMFKYMLNTSRMIRIVSISN